MAEKGKIYFVSDVHLGAPALKNNRFRERLFVEWLDMVKEDADALYLLGDVFDFWFEYRKVVPRGFTRVLGRLAEIADRGIPIHYFTGNHDLWIFDYLPREIGLILHRREFFTEILGKKFLLAHGDGLDPGEKGYLFMKRMFMNKGLQWLFARLHPNFAFYLAHRWSESSRLAQNDTKKEFKVKNENIFQFARDFLKNEWVDYFIFGHRHRMVDVEMEEGARFILLGDWVSYFSYGFFDGETFKLNKFH